MIESNIKTEINKRNTYMRWVALGLVAITNFGYYYSFSGLQPLEIPIQTIMNLNPEQFNAIYSYSSIPTIFLPMIGGLMIDFFGIRVILLGSVILTIGAGKSSFNLMILGNAINSLGFPILVCSSTLLYRWFFGKEFALSIGVALCAGRLASSLSSSLYPSIYTNTNSLFDSFFVSCIFSGLSVIAVILSNLLDKLAEKNERIETKRFDWNYMKSLNKYFWILACISVNLNGSFYALMNNLYSEIKKRFGFTVDSAGNWITIIYLTSAALSPIFGYINDKYGKRLFMLVFSASCFILANVYMAFLNDATSEASPNYWMIIGLILLGIYLSIFPSYISPCISIVIDKKSLGMAYGVVFSLDGLFLTILPFFTGYLEKNTTEKDGFFWEQLLIAFLGSLGLLTIIYLLFLHARENTKLNMPMERVNMDSKKLIDENSFVVANNQ